MKQENVLTNSLEQDIMIMDIEHRILLKATTCGRLVENMI